MPPLKLGNVYEMIMESRQNQAEVQDHLIINTMWDQDTLQTCRKIFHQELPQSLVQVTRDEML